MQTGVNGMSIFELEAESRSDMGKGASRRLRRDGKVPAVIYGGGEDPQSITLVHSEILKRLDHEAFYSHVLTVNVGGKANEAVLRDMQRHPAKAIINNGVTPTEARFNAEVAHGIARSGITAGRASELCNRLLEKYEKIIKHPSPDIAGKTYPELYDLETGKRLEEYDRLYDKVMEELIQIGVPFR